MADNTWLAAVIVELGCAGTAGSGAAVGLTGEAVGARAGAGDALAVAHWTVGRTGFVVASLAVAGRSLTSGTDAGLAVGG